ncbi:Protein of unknown function [Amycolatopsis pretoriensis]|uniref:DUF3558 domain-containing protein n=1 Tax=Amycolatopsis pretoriensis TaxID=218821 RepID=A0A1H5R206_9PSEU|nr:DUF3558 family protein [Amycolatopsis pretoriensis]SEF32365.1 Protein of unknown function [Amycolatopsis pretoriensis]
MTHSPARRTIVLAALAAGLAAGCTPSAPAQPADPPVDVPLIPGVGLAGAPRFAADSCEAVTVEQLNELGFSGGKRSRDGQRCVTGFGPVATVETSNRGNSLRTLYLEHARGHDTGNHWETVTINAYPAVTVSIDDNVAGKEDEGPLGCTLALAADNNTLVYITAATYDKPETGPWQHDPCGATKKIAEYVIQNLRT